MSIRAYINELKEYNIELKRLRDQQSVLRKKVTDVKRKIADYLNQKEQNGVKYNDMAIVLESKEKRVGKKIKDRDADAIDILASYGIYDPKEALDKILEARRGDLVEHQEVKIKKLK